MVRVFYCKVPKKTMAAKRNINGLTEKQQVFCDLYRASEDEKIRGNAKLCYMFAYGAKAKSAEANGPRVLRDKHVIAYLDNKRDQAIAQFDIQEADLLKEAANIAFLDPADFFDENGNMLPIQAMPENARRALGGFDISTLREFKKQNSEEDEKLEREETTTSKIKFIDKKSTIELLMKYKKMLGNDNAIDVNLGGVLLVPPGMTAAEWQKQSAQQNKT